MTEDDKKVRDFLCDVVDRVMQLREEGHIPIVILGHEFDTPRLGACVADQTFEDRWEFSVELTTLRFSNFGSFLLETQNLEKFADDLQSAGGPDEAPIVRGFRELVEERREADKPDKPPGASGGFGALARLKKE